MSSTNRLPLPISQHHVGSGDSSLCSQRNWLVPGGPVVTLSSKYLDLHIWADLMMPEELTDIFLPWVWPFLAVAYSGVISEDLKRQDLFFPLIGDKDLRKLFSGHHLTAEIMEQKLKGQYIARNTYFAKIVWESHRWMILPTTSKNYQFVRIGRIRFPK